VNTRYRPWRKREEQSVGERGKPDADAGAEEREREGEREKSKAPTVSHEHTRMDSCARRRRPHHPITYRTHFIDAGARALPCIFNR